MRATNLFGALLAVAFFATACSPPASQAPKVEVGPSEVMRATFPDCVWGEQKAAGLSVNAFTCPKHKLAPDESLPGFQMEITDGDGVVGRYPAIQVFAKAADAPVDAVIDAVRAASPGPFTATCVLTPNPNDPTGKTFQFMPTGEGKTAHEAFMAGASNGEPVPCGPMGPSEAGDRVFQQVEGAPDKVAYVNLGSEIQIFDVATLRAAP
ncbi:MAG: hypothetical protein ACOYM8_10480 [Caulobacterales bacterium]